jgi:hypothetical protein
VSKSLKKARHGMQFGNENEKRNAQFVHNNIAAKGM